MRPTNEQVAEAYQRTVPFICRQARPSIILADPPWQHGDKNANGERGAGFKYPTMSTREICEMDVAAVCADDALLYLWAVPPMLPDAFRVIEAWGFEYKTMAFGWVKLNLDGSPFMGLGHYTRGNIEPVLVARRGATMERAHKGISQVVVDADAVFAQRGEHSAKPAEVHRRIEVMYPGVVKLELFARTRREGWLAWGNQTPGGSDVEIPMQRQGLLHLDGGAA
jgi:site-specific DNA-methyltransferase (adenine-specific)